MYTYVISQPCKRGCSRDVRSTDIQFLQSAYEAPGFYAWKFEAARSGTSVYIVCFCPGKIATLTALNPQIRPQIPLTHSLTHSSTRPTEKKAPPCIISPFPHVVVDADVLIIIIHHVAPMRESLLTHPCPAALLPRTVSLVTVTVTVTQSG